MKIVLSHALRALGIESPNACALGPTTITETEEGRNTLDMTV
jgi:hypothetical protein